MKAIPFMLKHNLLLISMALTLTACASSSPLFTPAQPSQPISLTLNVAGEFSNKAEADQFMANYDQRNAVPTWNSGLLGHSIMMFPPVWITPTSALYRTASMPGEPSKIFVVNPRKQTAEPWEGSEDLKFILRYDLLRQTGVAVSTDKGKLVYFRVANGKPYRLESPDLSECELADREVKAQGVGFISCLSASTFFITRPDSVPSDNRSQRGAPLQTFLHQSGQPPAKVSEPLHRRNIQLEAYNPYLETYVVNDGVADNGIPFIDTISITGDTRHQNLTEKPFRLFAPKYAATVRPGVLFWDQTNKKKIQRQKSDETQNVLWLVTPEHRIVNVGLYRYMALGATSVSPDGCYFALPLQPLPSPVYEKDLLRPYHLTFLNLCARTF